MPSFPRHRLGLAPCLVALAMLLAMLVTPVLNSLGELHDLSHDALGGHAHAEHAAGHGAGADERAAPDGEEGDIFLALLHCAHCGGHFPLATLADFPHLASVPAEHIRIPREPHPVPSSPAQAPYRPPIAA